MALDYIARYPVQTDATDPNMPLGKAQNIVTSGDGTGTPWEKDLVNDDWGFKQAILTEAGITPSGAADNANASQYLGGVKIVIALSIPEIDLTTSYTLTDADIGKTLYLANAAAVTLNIPALLKSGFKCSIVQGHAGVITATAVGTTLNSLGGLVNSAGQWGKFTIENTGLSDTYLLSGDLA